MKEVIGIVIDIVLAIRNFIKKDMEYEVRFRLEDPIYYKIFIYNKFKTDIPYRDIALKKGKNIIYIAGISDVENEGIIKKNEFKSFTLRKKDLDVELSNGSLIRTNNIFLVGEVNNRKIKEKFDNEYKL